MENCPALLGWNLISTCKVVIRWSRLAGMKFYPVLMGLLQTVHKLYPAITCKKFHSGQDGIPVLYCRDEIFPCKRFSRLRGMKKLTHSLKTSIEVHFNRSKIFLLWRRSARYFSQFSQETARVGISLQPFSSAILLKRDSNTNVFLWILRNF